MENLRDRFKVIQDIENITLSEPSVLKYLNSDNNYKYFNISKDVEREIYRELHISKSVSNRIYNISPELWKQLITICSTLDDSDTFKLSKYKYITFDNNLIGLSKSYSIEDCITKLCNMIDDYSIYQIHNTSLSKSVLHLGNYEKDSKTYNIIAIIELNFDKGYYKLSTGILYDNHILLLPPSIKETNFSNFVTSDIEYELSMAKKLMPNMNLDINLENTHNIKLSLREILSILKSSNIKISSAKDGAIVSDNIIPTDLEEYFRSTGQTVRSLNSLSYLDKSIKFTDHSISLWFIIEYITEVYIQSDNVISNGFDIIRDIQDSADFDTIRTSKDIRRMLKEN